MFKEIQVHEIADNVFEMIGKQWMLVTAARSDKEVNTMTASWGGLGVLWGKPVAFVFIRPQRYTRAFMDDANQVTLSFYEEQYRSMLSYMGSTSGRDENKIKHEHLTLQFDGEAPYFEEAAMVIKGKKLYRQTMEAACVQDAGTVTKFYEKDDWHILYVYEIEKVLVRE